ncbi:MAG: zinc ribbon domain-containing protein [Deltaproteobacteria bacterium]|nr:zinc ribbon domain-containing protein [Candidatus Anaeroferrophillacea bacterium]
MPLYEYLCRSCGKTFEVLQRVGADNSALICPVCGARQPEKLISSCAVQVGAGGCRPPAGGGGFS